MSEIFSLSDEQFVRLKPLLPTDTRGVGQGDVDVWSRSVGLRFCTAANVSFPPNQVVERTAGIVCTGSEDSYVPCQGFEARLFVPAPFV